MADPIITTQPTNQTVDEGGPYTFTVVAEAGGWTPAEITTSLWLDASDETTITGTPTVTDWVDKSGNAYNFSATGNPQTDTSTENSLNVIDLDGTDYFVSDDTAATWKFLHDGTAAQVYIVIKPSTSSNPDALMGLYGTNSGGSATVGHSVAYDDRSGNGYNNGFLASVRRGVASTAAAVVNGLAGDVLSPNTFTVLSSKIDADNGTAADRLEFNETGTLIPYANVDTGTVSTSDPLSTLTIGAFGDSGARFPINGSVAEMVIVQGAFSEADHQRMEGYLAWKWGLEADLPLAHPYKDAAPIVGEPVDELWDDVISSTDFEVGAATTAPTDFKTASVWTQSGASGISDASAEYGTQSGYASTGGYMLLKNADLALGTSDFCIDVSLKAGHAATTHFIFDGRPVSTNGVYPALAKINNKVAIFVDNTTVATSTSDVANNDWTKIRWERVGGTSTLYMDGVVEASFADTYDYLYSATNGWAVGSSGFSLGTLVLAGNIDSWRVTATSRDGATYTPATAPFPTQGPTLTYQWEEETSPAVWEEAVGETASVLTGTAVLADNGRKFRCAVTQPPIGPVDADWDSVVYLSDFTGGVATSLKDNADWVHTPGLGTIGHATQAFPSGTGSFYWDGNQSSSNGLVITTATDKLQFGTGDFTMEFMWRRTANRSGGLLLRGGDTIYTSPYIGMSVWDWSGGTYYPRVGDYTGPGPTTGVSNPNNPVMASNASSFLHFVVQRKDGVVNFFVNGAAMLTPNGGTNARDFTTLNRIDFGGFVAGLSTKYALDGYVSDVRITKGVGRYPDAGGFAVPTEPFPTQGPA